MFSIFLIFLNYLFSLECQSNVRKPIDHLKTRWASPNPNTDVDRWIKPYRPMAVIGSALRDRLLRDMREANI
jgi:hypothetical protein